MFWVQCWNNVIIVIESHREYRKTIAIISSTDLCLEVEGNLVVGAKVIVNQNALAVDEEEIDGGENVMGGDNQQDGEQGIQDDLKCSSKLLVLLLK